MSDLAILYEDAHCLAVSKPPGQFTQGSWAPPGELTLEAAIRHYLNPNDPDGVYVGIVHRLDRPTSGLLLWAKTPKAARRLSSQFERRTVVKEYWAIIESKSPNLHASGAEEVWTDWLTRADANGIVHRAPENTPGAREAITRVLLENSRTLTSGFAWLRLWPQTGRTHQLRVQASAREMPILGDVAYGALGPFPVAHGIALHARALSINHPATGQSLVFTAPTPTEWARFGFAAAEMSGEAGRSGGTLDGA